MLNYKNKVIILLGVFLIFIITGSAVTYSWFGSKTVTIEEGSMGRIETDLKNSSAKSFISSASVEGAFSKSFSFKNDSNIESYVRVGYTPYFSDLNKNQVIVDANSLTLKDAKFFVNDAPIGLMVKEIEGFNGYKKNFISPAFKEGQNQYYYKLKPGENITGTLVFSVMLDSSDIVPDISITTETIQATEKALEDASSYGWDVSYNK